MKWRRAIKPLGFVGVGLLYLWTLGLIGLLMLLTNPLADAHLPLGAFFGAWPFVMLIGLIALVWRHRERGVWWLAVAIGLAPHLVEALIRYDVVN